MGQPKIENQEQENKLIQITKEIKKDILSDLTSLQNLLNSSETLEDLSHIPFFKDVPKENDVPISYHYTIDTLQRQFSVIKQITCKKINLDDYKILDACNRVAEDIEKKLASLKANEISNRDELIKLRNQHRNALQQESLLKNQLDELGKKIAELQSQQNNLHEKILVQNDRRNYSHETKRSYELVSKQLQDARINEDKFYEAIYKPNEDLLKKIWNLELKLKQIEDLSRLQKLNIQIQQEFLARLYADDDERNAERLTNPLRIDESPTIEPTVLPKTPVEKVITPLTSSQPKVTIFAKEFSAAINRVEEEIIDKKSSSTNHSKKSPVASISNSFVKSNYGTDSLGRAIEQTEKACNVIAKKASDSFESLGEVADTASRKASDVISKAWNFGCRFFTSSPSRPLQESPKTTQKLGCRS